MKPRLPLLLTVLATALGLFLRFWRLAETPPLLWHDEALFVNWARGVLEYGWHAIYFPTNFGGAHPMLVYLTAGAGALLGLTPTTGRIVTALAGGLAIPLTYLAAKDLLVGVADKSLTRWLAAWCASLQAVLLVNLTASRVGQDPILTPIFAILCVDLFARGLQHRKWAWFAGAGAALGLALYTGPYARLLPATLGVIALLAVTIRSPESVTRDWRTPLAGLALAGAVAGAIYAPLGIYFLRHPDEFFLRTRLLTQEAFGPEAGGPLIGLLRNLGASLGGVSLKGDWNPRHNLPGRPLFDPLLSAFFWTGATVAIRRLRTHSSAGLLLAWTAGMALPTVLSPDAPAFIRSLAAVPAMIILAAMGMSAAYRWLAGRFGAVAARLLMGTALATSAFLNVYDYFERYARHPALFDGFTAGEYQAAFVARDLAEQAAVYLSPWTPAQTLPNFDLLLQGTSSRGVDSTVCLPYQPNRSTHYFLDVIAQPDGPDRLQGLFPEGGVSQRILHRPEPFPLTEVFTLPAGSRPALGHPLEVRFGEEILLSGADFPVEPVRPGETITVTLAWKTLSAIHRDLVAFVHVAADVGSPPAVQHDSAPCQGAYPTFTWRAGEAVLDPHPITLPPRLRAGRYALLVGMYTWPDLARLPAQGSASQENRVSIGELTVSGEGAADPGSLEPVSYGLPPAGG